MPVLNWKKIILVLGLAILAVLAIWLMWRFLNQPQGAPVSPTTTNNTGTGNLPVAGPKEPTTPVQPGEGGLTPADNIPIETETTTETTVEERENKVTNLFEYTSAEPTLSADGQSVQYYDQVDNKFYRLSDSGEPELLSDESFFNVQNVVWSPDKDRAIIEYPDNRKIIYNFKTNKQISLPSHFEDFSFSPQGDKIAFKSLGYDVNNRWLAVMKNDGTETVPLEKIGVNADKVLVSWSPNNQSPAMFLENSAADQKEVYFIGFNKENFKSMKVPGLGFEPLWSPSGNRLLYSVYNSVDGYRPSLWISDAQGNNIGNNLQPLNLNTWADKCTFLNEQEVYCAVPRSLPEGAGFYPDVAKESTDDLLLVNLASGQSTVIDASGQYNMTKLILTADQKALYFTDKISGKLLKLSL